MQAADDILLNPNVAVCVLTRLREAGLRRVLGGIAEQQVTAAVGFRIRVIVVDNDPLGSGQQVCESLRARYPWDLEYAIETSPGIPFARNRALDLITDTDDMVAFIDDDEVPSETWLAELVRAQRQYRADVVFGPVAPHFADEVPLWIKRGGFFDREVHPTGTKCSIGGHVCLPSAAMTGNVLMTTNMLRESGIRFDAKYQYTGGSDKDFFRRVTQIGYCMIWSDEAVAVEWIPQSRATLAWLAQRHFRHGALEGCTSSVWERFPMAILGSGRVCFGASCAAFFWLFGWHRFAMAVRWASYGLGLMYGAAGKQFQEYRAMRGV